MIFMVGPTEEDLILEDLEDMGGLFEDDSPFLCPNCLNPKKRFKKCPHCGYKPTYYGDTSLEVIDERDR